MKFLSRHVRIDTFTAGIDKARIWRIHVLHAPTGIGLEASGEGYGLISKQRELLKLLKELVEG